MNVYTVYICGIKGYQYGVPVEHVDAKSAAEEIAFKHTGIQRVKYLGTVLSKRGLCKQDIHIYEDEHGWIYNVHRNGVPAYEKLCYNQA
jgi:hypothetical protein